MPARFATLLAILACLGNAHSARETSSLRESCEGDGCAARGDCECGDQSGPTMRNKASSSEFASCDVNCGPKGRCVNETGVCECNFGRRGSGCEEHAVCVVFINASSKRVGALTIAKGDNETLLDAYYDAPVCDQCRAEVDDRNLCFSLKITPFGKYGVICFVGTESPCYTEPSHGPRYRIGRFIGIAVGVTVAIVAIAAAIGYTAVLIIFGKKSTSPERATATSRTQRAAASICPRESFEV